MPSTVFPFAVLRPYSYPPHHETTIQGLNNGNEQRRVEMGDHGRFRVKFQTRVPYGSETNETWQAFVRTMRGAGLPFLFKDRKTLLYYSVTHANADGQVGTGNGSTTAFPLVHKHIDASTLVVKKATVTQTLTTHYTVSGNNTAPIVTFGVAPGLGEAVTVAYEFYMPVFFANDPPQGRYLGGDANFGEIDVELVETGPGASRV